MENHHLWQGAMCKGAEHPGMGIRIVSQVLVIENKLNGFRQHYHGQEYVTTEHRIGLDFEPILKKMLGYRELPGL
ncbi:hypothetical protein GOBAR_DD12877 [Gossypium barbadense]|nr:hypothetical protein GOBAR_DD12877 [Gossypium barbadense]